MPWTVCLSSSTWRHAANSFGRFQNWMRYAFISVRNEDGFVNYEGRRFGVPYSYPGATARIMRSGDTLYIYSADLSSLLTTHDVTWSRRDSFCEGQYKALEQPEELPTAPVMTRIRQLPKPSGELSFAKFDFDGEEPV